MSELTQEQLDNYRVNRAGWPAGEWDTEPDREQWTHAGYACLLVRNNRLGHWCGYVGVDRLHPCYGKAYDEVDVAVHGGLTYADRCAGPICHAPEPGMPEDVWWLGFDAAHWRDLSPGLAAHELAHPLLRSHGERHLCEDTYRNRAYMRAETERLAEQLRAHA